jgi:hypothetical protein
VRDIIVVTVSVVADVCRETLPESKSVLLPSGMTDASKELVKVEQTERKSALS